MDVSIFHHILQFYIITLRVVIDCVALCFVPADVATAVAVALDIKRTTRERHWYADGSQQDPTNITGSRQAEAVDQVKVYGSASSIISTHGAESVKGWEMEWLDVRYEFGARTVHTLSHPPCWQLNSCCRIPTDDITFIRLMKLFSIKLTKIFVNDLSYGEWFLSYLCLCLYFCRVMAGGSSKSVIAGSSFFDTRRRRLTADEHCHGPMRKYWREVTRTKRNGWLPEI